MLGSYPNRSAKPRGSNLNEKNTNTIFQGLFISMYVDLTYIDTSIYTNKHKHTTNTQKTPHSHIYTPTNK